MDLVFWMSLLEIVSKKETHDEAFELAPVWDARWLEVRSFIALHLARAARERATRATSPRKMDKSAACLLEPEASCGCARGKDAADRSGFRLRLGFTLCRLEVDCAGLSGVGAPGLLIFLAQLARGQLVRAGSLSLTS